MSDGGLGFIGRASRFDNFHNQGNNNGSMRYPSPFFDIGHTYLPTSVKQMFRWCRYYFMVNPLINSVTYKMAEYPITQIQVQEADSVLKDKWTKFIDTGIKLRNVLIEVGLDFFVRASAVLDANRAGFARHYDACAARTPANAGAATATGGK